MSEVLHDAPIVPPHLKQFCFNSETARTSAFQAHIARRAKSNAYALSALNGDCASDGFREQSAFRTREQMKLIQLKIQQQLEKAVLDSKVLKELTEALARLETIEQKLSGRASPGSLRPRDNTKGRRSDRQQAAPEPEVEEEKAPEPGPENG